VLRRFIISSVAADTACASPPSSLAEDPKDALLREYLEQIEKLKSQLGSDGLEEEGRRVYLLSADEARAAPLQT